MYDFCIIGGGIVGLATARALRDRIPGARLLLLEKEDGFALHQTGHNSGVIHAGIYYAPGSLKAKLCREGAEATKTFCRENNIPFETCGKLLVATNDAEMGRMEILEQRARENDIAFTRLSTQDLRKDEPNIAGLGALLVHATGIVDYGVVCRAIAARLKEDGADIRLCAAVTAIREQDASVQIECGHNRWEARRLVVCAGLQSDRLALLAGLKIEHRIVPFRGEYYVLPQTRADVTQRLIYPIPDPDLPFLGIHLTRTINGGMTVGPNAVLGFAREGYPKGSFSLSDVASMAVFPGFWKMTGKNSRSAVREFANSLSRTRYLKECQKYCPSLTLEDLTMPHAGIRAQAVMKDGSLVHDFLFKQTQRMLHVCNAPSPAATSAIPIGQMIVERLLNGVPDNDTQMGTRHENHT
ncbi:L-2-hydroxyglutarate oxidase [Ensifer adhaerens]|uniref:L-2-hydroxyglutarate oxidase n=1 Tax=Ensifer adhaerens TaxID=106592 RepID=UPI001CBBC53A|nr:L-2-hydroxyglutarate oxidase [Ensifer adhaerens]MBZ7924228.1 L-2-hydroxyglutarate oxidase [Ensifer adhaerens]UAX96518.1 L-2-hydroxyglutarate oxidase [Ensifer adhaerens]UAY04138.1 L-2-hydroxyglutarate oxidase [Ensifer adhaerens]UAY12124.1 L-2-hydroxyglutarate oxidase [Ensifer adhaerens]